MIHPTNLSIERMEVSLDPIPVEGELAIPSQPIALVIFIHGSGSSRFSQRNRFVALKLQQCGFATLLVDLLSPAEDTDTEARFDIPLLTRRVDAITRWAQARPELANLAFGYFGASTGSAAALSTAAQFPDHVRSIISRGGRPDLAAAHLPHVSAPTLLIVGGEDHEVLQLNRRALRHLNPSSRLEVVPGATHLFSEPGALEQVARLASSWFLATLSSRNESS